jgi:hypothetical protein
MFSVVCGLASGWTKCSIHNRAAGVFISFLGTTYLLDATSAVIYLPSVNNY